jgi:hypothetical protein
MKTHLWFLDWCQRRSKECIKELNAGSVGGHSVGFVVHLDDRGGQTPGSGEYWSIGSKTVTETPNRLQKFQVTVPELELAWSWAA